MAVALACGRCSSAVCSSAVSLQGAKWTLIPRHLLWVDLALGPAIACLLVGVATGRPRLFVRVLDSRPIRSLGLFVLQPLSGARADRRRRLRADRGPEPLPPRVGRPFS